MKKLGLAGMAYMLLALQGCGKAVLDSDAQAGNGGATARPGADGGALLGVVGAAGDRSGAGAAGEVGETTEPKGRLLLNEQVDLLRVDESRLYWLTDPSGLSGCISDDCVATRVEYSPDDIAFPTIGKDRVYFENRAQSRRETVSCLKTGCVGSLTALGVAPDSPSAEGDYLYFYDGGGIGRCPYTGCANAPESVAKSESFLRSQPSPIRFQGAYAYWLTTSTVRRAPKDGSQPAETLATLSAVPQELDVSKHAVYWIDASNHVLSCPLAGCGNQLPTQVCTNDTQKLFLSTDDSGAYWKEDGAVHFCAPTGCGATSRVLTTPNVVSFGIDDRFVYWNHKADDESPPVGTGIGTSIRRVLKPAAPAE